MFGTVPKLCCLHMLTMMHDDSLFLVPRNYDPTLHPFEVCREYTRALNATKLERVFAKPFLASLDGHRDGVNCMAKHSTSLSTLLSGSCDGEVTTASPQLVTWLVFVWRCHCVQNKGNTSLTGCFMRSSGESVEFDEA